MIEMMVTGMLFWMVWFVASGGDSDSDSGSGGSKNNNNNKKNDHK
jgi:hypothetical protein